jgi:hypothetical protein
MEPIDIFLKIFIVGVNQLEPEKINKDFVNRVGQ